MRQIARNLREGFVHEGRVEDSGTNSRHCIVIIGERGSEALRSAVAPQICDYRITMAIIALKADRANFDKPLVIASQLRQRDILIQLAKNKRRLSYNGIAAALTRSALGGPKFTCCTLCTKLRDRLLCGLGRSLMMRKYLSMERDNEFKRSIDLEDKRN